MKARCLGAAPLRALARRGAAAAAAAVAIALLPMPMPAQAAGEPATLARARAALEARDFATALPLYEHLVAARPADADLLIEAARAQGYADHNGAAARLYRQALQAAPARRADILPSLAWQTLWAGDAGTALALFDELARAGKDRADRADALDGAGQAHQALGDLDAAARAYAQALALAPDHRRLQLRLARVLLWQDRHAEAIARLQALQREAPDDRDVGWTLANALNFAGRHRAALREFARWGAPRNAGERVDLARAWYWAGDDERAAALLHEPIDAEARWLRDWRVVREAKNYVYAGIDGAHDRDHLEVTALTVGGGWRPDARTLFEVQSRHAWIRSPDGAASGQQLQGLARWRLGALDAPGGVWLPSLALRANRYGRRDFVGGTAHLVWLPRDGWRVDADASRDTIETPRAIAAHIEVDTVSLGADWKPDARWSASAALATLRFSDANTRQRINARVDYAIALRPRWVAGIEAMGFTASNPSGARHDDHGYWNPSRYHELRAYSALAVEQRPFEFTARVAFGSSREVDGDARVSHSTPHQWELAVAADAAPGLRLRAAIGASGSGFGLAGGGAGYWRRYASIGLVAWF